MIRKATIASMATCAVFAVMAIGASGAGAAKFTAATYPATLHANQSGSIQLSIGTGVISCTTYTLKGTLAGPSETQTFEANLAGCPLFGTGNATITGLGAGECDFLFSANGSFDLRCPAGKAVAFTTLTCVVHLNSTGGANQNLKTVAYKNNAPGAGEVTIETNVTNITAVVTGPVCPVTAATYNNATLAGKMILKGTDGKGNFDAVDVQ